MRILFCLLTLLVSTTLFASYQFIQIEKNDLLGITFRPHNVKFANSSFTINSNGTWEIRAQGLEEKFGKEVLKGNEFSLSVGKTTNIPKVNVLKLTTEDGKEFKAHIIKLSTKASAFMGKKYGKNYQYFLSLYLNDKVTEFNPNMFY